MDEGVFLATNRSWSIDDRRLNFQFGTEIGWEISAESSVGYSRRDLHRRHSRLLGGSTRSPGARNGGCTGSPTAARASPGSTPRLAGAAPERFRNVQVGVA